MNEIKSDATDDLFGPPPRTLLGMKCPVLVFFAVLGACWLGWAGYFSRSATCAVCRMDRVDHAFLGLTWADHEETECSRWYRENVEPAHDHLWVRGSRCRGYVIPGFTWDVAGSIASPVAGLSKNTQLEVYRHFANRLEAKKIFLHAARMDEDEEGHHRFMKLTYWADRGFPGTWEEWLKTYEDKVEGSGS